ncbi:MAG TPA: hypothetical protein VF389_11750 [Woeseiaceae bacterium]
MMDFFVSLHAIERYRQRVEAVSIEEARRRLSTDAIKAMAAQGLQTRLKLPCGCRVCVKHGGVVSVIPPHQILSPTMKKRMSRNRRRQALQGSGE